MACWTYSPSSKTQLELQWAKECRPTILTCDAMTLQHATGITPLVGRLLTQRGAKGWSATRAAFTSFMGRWFGKNNVKSPLQHENFEEKKENEDISSPKPQ